MKVLLNSCHLNGHILGFHPQTQKLQPHFGSERVKKFLFFHNNQKEDERLRTQLRRENQQRRMRERSQAKGLSASFLEPDRYEDDGEDLEQSLLAIKKKYKKKLAEG